MASDDPLPPNGAPAQIDSIAARLLKIIFGCYFVVTVVVTVLQLSAEYRHAKSRLDEEIAAMQSTFGPGIADAMWRYNNDILRGILAGMQALPIVVGIKVEDEAGNAVSAVGTVQDKDGHKLQAGPDGHLSPLQNDGGLFAEMFSRSFPVVYVNEAGQPSTIGRWAVYSNQQIVINQVEYGFFLVLVNSVVKTMALWFIFLLVVQRWLAKPLRQLSDFVGKLNIDNLGDEVFVLKDKGRHELHQLAGKLNEMTATLRGSVADKSALVAQLENEQAKIRELNASLEQRVAERTSELVRDRARLAKANDDLADALETLQRAQEELHRSEKLASLGAMVAGVAHELNTPIGNCITVASSLADHVDRLAASYATGLRRSEVDQFIRDALLACDLLTRNGLRAGNLVAAFKQVAVDQTSSQRRRFDLAEVVRENVSALSPTWRNTPYTLVHDCQEGVVLDSFPGPLGQVIFNLVTNAVLHGFEGRSHGHMLITARLVADGEVELRIADDGCGIAPEYVGRIYDPFFTTRLAGGSSGLGLSITHNIVTTILGGKIKVDSSPGAGTTFTITLPLEAPHRQAVAARKERA